MAVVFANDVKETSTTTGTGTLNLGGASSNSRTFLAGIGNGNQTAYKIDDAAGNREYTWGQVASGTPQTLTRGQFISSTTGSRINFGAGIKTITAVPMSELFLLPGVSPALAETDIASATTCDLGSLYTLRARITGTTTITSLGSQPNTFRIVRFAAALTLTHNATSLILPNGRNISTMADDIGFFVSDGSGNWRLLSYQTTAQSLYGRSSQSATFPAMFIGDSSGFGGRVGSAPSTYLYCNSYFDGSVHRYIQNNAVCFIEIGMGGLAFHSAASGTAGNTASISNTLNIGLNGNVTNSNNSYGAISDIKLKQDIVPCSSQWADVKALAGKVSKYHLKSNPDGPLQIGLIAQDVLEISPGLVASTPDYHDIQVGIDDEGRAVVERQPTGTETLSVQYSILNLKLLKALGEAMEKIEQLQARLDAAGL